MIRGGLSKGLGMIPKPFSLAKVEVNNIIYFSTSSSTSHPELVVPVQLLNYFKRRLTERELLLYLFPKVFSLQEKGIRRMKNKVQGKEEGQLLICS